jgi:hypothetical protein
VVVFERGNLLWIFNFHPTESFTDYRVGTDWAGEYRVVLSSDDKQFGGHDRIDSSVKHFTTPMEWNGRKNWLQVSQRKRGGGAGERCGGFAGDPVFWTDAGLPLGQKKNHPGLHSG